MRKKRRGRGRKKKRCVCNISFCSVSLYNVSFRIKCKEYVDDRFGKYVVPARIIRLRCSCLEVTAARGLLDQKVVTEIFIHAHFKSPASK